MSWTPDEMAAQAALALQDGEFVDIGGGLAQEVLKHVVAGTEIWVHLGEARPGMTQYPTDDYMDAGFIVTGLDDPHAQRTMTFHSSESFAAMSSRTADIAVRAVGDAAQVRAVVADAMESVGAKRAVVLVSGDAEPRGIWQGAGPGIPVRIVTHEEALDVTPDGRQKPVA